MRPAVYGTHVVNVLVAAVYPASWDIRVDFNEAFVFFAWAEIFVICVGVGNPSEKGK